MCGVTPARSSRVEIAAVASASRPRHRILFLADHLGPDAGGTAGIHGVTTYLLDALPVLKATGCEVGACFLRQAHPAAEALRAAKINVHFLGTSRFDPFVVRQVEKLVLEEQYGILHCTQFRASLLARVLARKRAGVKAVLHLHDLNMPPGPIRWTNRALARRDDLGVCVSHAAGDIAVRGYSVAPDRVRVVHTGIDTGVFRPLSVEQRAEVRR
ncbi:MAG: hypothetical protein EHM50_11645, partial [Lysobacterales bacterium]